jgi:hypothetical protein
MDTGTVTQVCAKCNKSFPIEEFYENKRRGRRERQCKTCRRRYFTAKRVVKHYHRKYRWIEVENVGDLPSVDGLEFRFVVGASRYCVGSDGTVWKHLGLIWKEVQGVVGKCDRYIGYKLVWITFDDRKRRKTRVHVAVATAFHGTCPEGQQARHLDGDPLNNCCDNLKWGTPKENSEDQVRHRLKGLKTNG